MKQYHITWFDLIEDYYSKGETFEAANEAIAISLFRAKYGARAIFLSCVSADILNLKKGTQHIPQNKP